MIKIRARLAERQAAIAKALQGERGVQGVRSDGNLQLFTFSADALFPPDDANLSPSGAELLHRFAQVLQQHPEYYTRIEVEGHTDKNPSRNYSRKEDIESDHGNWRLAAERAITVVQLFQRRGIPGQRLGVVGRSLYDPVVHEYSPEALKQNRRVQVRLFYSEVTP
jgi:chemotaxis protein MotB